MTNDRVIAHRKMRIQHFPHNVMGAYFLPSLFVVH